MVGEFGVLELLEDQSEVEDHEEVGLHFKAIEKELKVALHNVEDEEYDPIYKTKSSNQTDDRMMDLPVFDQLEFKIWGFLLSYNSDTFICWVCHR